MACTDGGYTGRSLSLVCRFFNAASSSAKYNSISILGSNQTRGFARLIISQPRIPRVRHLFLKYRNSRPAPDSFKAKKVKGMAAADAMLEYELPFKDINILLFETCRAKGVGKAVRERQDAMSDTLPFAFRSILPFIAPYLITFTLVSSQQFSTSQITFPANLRFPRLLELTLYSCHISQAVSSAATHKSPPFPAVKYLHLAFHCCSKDPSLYLHWTPSLSHLRVTGDVCEYSRFLRELQSVVTPPSSDQQDPSFSDPSETPNRLRNLSHISFLPCTYDIPKRKYLPPPEWLQEAILSDKKGLLEVLPPTKRTPKTKRGYAYHEYIYGYADVYEDWNRGVERIGMRTSVDHEDYQPTVDRSYRSTNVAASKNGFLSSLSIFWCVIVGLLWRLFDFITFIADSFVVCRALYPIISCVRVVRSLKDIWIKK